MFIRNAILPGFKAKFARLRNSMKYPLQFSGAHVISANMSRSSGSPLIHSRSGNEKVFINYTRRGCRDEKIFHIPSQFIVKVNTPITTETNFRFAALCINAKQVGPCRIEYPAVLFAIAPVSKSAIIIQHKEGFFVGSERIKWIELPFEFASRSIQCKQFHLWRGAIQNAV